jgi:hypothetical protein
VVIETRTPEWFGELEPSDTVTAENMTNDNQEDANLDEKVEDELCPLCPDQQPPSASSPSFRDVRIDKEGNEAVVVEPRKDPALKWLGCTNCDDNWYHTACLAREVRRDSQSGKTEVKEEVSGEDDQQKRSKPHNITSTFPQPLVEQLLHRSLFWDYTQYVRSWSVAVRP